MKRILGAILRKFHTVMTRRLTKCADKHSRWAERWKR